VVIGGAEEGPAGAVAFWAWWRAIGRLTGWRADCLVLGFLAERGWGDETVRRCKEVTWTSPAFVDI
jgi:hypothetical protein